MGGSGIPVEGGEKLAVSATVSDDLCPRDDLVNIYERPHLGMLHSAVYFLWRSTPREVRGFSTYTVMGLICGIDIEVEHRGVGVKFIRDLSVEHCGEIADAVLNPPDGMPSRFNPKALLHICAWGHRVSHEWAGLILQHITDEGQRHVLMDKVLKEGSPFVRGPKPCGVSRNYGGRRRPRLVPPEVRGEINAQARRDGLVFPYPFACAKCGFLSGSAKSIERHVKKCQRGAFL